MKIKLSPSRFYLSNIIFYTCLLAFPLSAAIEQVSETEGSKPSITSIINNVDECLEIDKTENSDQKSSLETTKYKQIMASFNKLNKRYDQLKKEMAELQNILQNIPIDATGKDQMTSFLSAVKKGQLDIAKLLKQRGADINAKNKYRNNALHLACLYSGSEAMVTWLLDECKIDIESKGWKQQTPFLCAAYQGQLAIAKLLRKRGADINAKNEYENNALHKACLFSRSEAMVTWLLDECHIDIESKGWKQQTPFLCAAYQGQLAIAKLLRKRGADINAKNEYENNALHKACLFSRSEAIVTWLLDECHIDIEAKGFDQRTPFLSAALQGQLAIAKLLKERCANIHAKDKDGNNALHLACYFSGSKEMVTWLLEVCKIDIESKRKYEVTPFLCAAYKGQLAIAKLLKQRGANIDVKGQCGKKALWWAKNAEPRNIEMEKWLSSVCKPKKTTWFNWFKD